MPQEKLQLQVLTPRPQAEPLQLQVLNAPSPNVNPQLSKLDQVKQFLANEPYLQTLEGVGQSIGKTGLGAVQWLQDIPRQVREARSGQPEPSQVTPTPPWLEPHGALQKAGNFIGTTLQQAALTGATGGASLPAQVAAGGLGSGLIAGAQGDNPQLAAGIGMGAPILSKALQPITPSLRKGAQERVASVLDPRGLSEQKELSKVLPETTKKMPFAWSSEGLAKKFKDQAKQVADQIDEVLDKADDTGITMKMNRVARQLDSQIQSAKKDAAAITPEGQTLISQLQKVKNEIKEIGRIKQPYSKLGTEAETGLPQIIQKQTVPARLQRVRELKQQYGEIVAGPTGHFTRDVADASRASAAKEGFHALQRGMADAVPEITPLNKEFSRLATVRDLLQKSELRQIAGGKSGVGKIAELGAVAHGTVTGKPQFVVSGAVLAGLKHLVDSTPWKLANANLRTAFANAVENGDLQLATQIAGQITNSLATRQAP